MQINPFEARIRHTKRYAEVLEVLARHGFAEFVARSGLDKVIQRGRQAIGGEVRAEVHHRPLKERLRMVLEDLGPTYIKLGQVLSTRPDLIPPEVAEEFKKLQSEVPSIAFPLIRARLEEEFGPRLDEMFASIDEQAIAAASIAQTHRAVMRDGRPVILKVVRPGTEDIIKTDMEVLHSLAGFTEKHFEDAGFNPTEVVNEFAKQLNKEVDMTHEAQSIERLRNFFVDDPNVHFTTVHWEATTKKVLAMDQARGRLLTRIDVDTLSPQLRRRIVENGTDAVMGMCLDLGFFHADPHPGNIFVEDDGSITFIDCGMTGLIERRTQKKLAQLVQAVAAPDLDRVVRLLLDLSNGDPSFENNRAFRQDVWEVVSRFQVSSLEGIDVTGLLNEFFDVLRRYGFHCPADLVFLIKALTTIQGVGQELDPEFDFVAFVEPRVRELVMREYTAEAILERLKNTMHSYLELAEELPKSLKALTTAAGRRTFKVNLKHDGLTELDDVIENASKYIAVAMIIAAMIIGSAILSAAPEEKKWGLFHIIGTISLFAGAVFVVRIFLSMKPVDHDEDQ